MIPEWVGIAVSIMTVVISLIGSLAVVSFKSGKIAQKVADLELQKANAADVVAMKESLAEIKGMFVLRLRD